MWMADRDELGDRPVGVTIAGAGEPEWRGAGRFHLPRLQQDLELDVECAALRDLSTEGRSTVTLAWQGGREHEDVRIGATNRSSKGMMIEIFRDVRIKFAGSDRAKGTFEEYKDASLSSSCSFGTYSVDPATNKVTMKIDRSTFPNYDDTTQVRAYELKGNILSWKVPARPDGSIPITVLRRIPH